MTRIIHSCKCPIRECAIIIEENDVGSIVAMDGCPWDEHLTYHWKESSADDVIEAILNSPHHLFSCGKCFRPCILIAKDNGNNGLPKGCPFEEGSADCDWVRVTAKEALESLEKED